MMTLDLTQKLHIGSLALPHRLIQGPLAGYSCAPFRALFSHYQSPAFCVSEMISAHFLIHQTSSQTKRYRYRSPDEKRLCYQLSGNDPSILAKAAKLLNDVGADLIDLNCGCPKLKIRKKGAGSALLADGDHLARIVSTVKAAITCPLTVKIRLQSATADAHLAHMLVNSGADALVVHGRRWTDDYTISCNLAGIKAIKETVHIPVIANGDIYDKASLTTAIQQTGCDGFMISRAGTGKPWLYQTLLTDSGLLPDLSTRIALFLEHLEHLAALESSHKAVLQSKSLVKYYFRECFSADRLQAFYQLTTLKGITEWLRVRYL
tara:strand:- start:6766 stop:7728 length:963 start_codon:yes stop_codon:yes gene_type:complete